MIVSTLNDVARMAGVSKTLVSRYINQQSGVSKTNREKIAAAIRALDYQPNALARSLVKHRTNTIGILMDTLCDSYFFPLIRGLEEAANKTDYDLVFCSSQCDPAHKQKAIKYLMQGRSDGMILYGSRLGDEELMYSLAESRFPFVVVENHFPALKINNIFLDNEFGADLAVSHLISRGCRRIFHVHGDHQIRVSLDREAGFIKSMQRHGFPVNSRMIIPGDFQVGPSYQSMRQFLAETPADQLPDGLFCSSDKSAYGVILALQERGIRVPEDVKVVGFDNEIISKPPMLPVLTTLSQPLAEMGKAALELILEQITHPEAECRQITFYPELQIGESA